MQKRHTQNQMQDLSKTCVLHGTLTPTEKAHFLARYSLPCACEFNFQRRPTVMINEGAAT